MKRMEHPLNRILTPLLTLLLASCGGSFVGVAPPQPVAVDHPPAASSLSVAVNKFRSVGSEWVALTERLRKLEDTTAPERQLLTARDGTQPPVAIDPPAGWSLIDFALHPSGQMTLVLATNKELRLQRRAANGDLIDESNFTDAAAPADPFIGNAGPFLDSQALVPLGTRDAVRLEPVGEDVLLALRTGRNAVIAQRLTWAGAGIYSRRWRTLVEPGVPIDMVRLIGGTFDPFASLDNQWHLALDVDAQGRSAIAVSLGHTQLPAAHRKYFHEPIDAALVSGAIVTILDATGLRLSATAINTQVLSEVHAVRWANDKVLVAGRMLTTGRGDGGGWDGFLARLRFGDPAAEIQTLDFDRGDVILDVASMADGRIVLAGNTAYTQNPTGGSISENAEPLLAVLPSAGMPARRIMLRVGPRHNQVRTVAAWQEHWLIGGFENGPGTHSADSDPALLISNGYLREQVF